MIFFVVMLLSVATTSTLIGVFDIPTESPAWWAVIIAVPAVFATAGLILDLILLRRRQLRAAATVRSVIDAVEGASDEKEPTS